MTKAPPKLFGEQPEADFPHRTGLQPPTAMEQMAFDSIFETAPDDRASKRKPVQIAHMFPRGRRLTFLQKKAWLVLHDYAVQQGLMELVDGRPRRQRFRVLATQLHKDLDYDSKDYAHIKRTLEAGIGTVIDWGPSSRDKNGEKVMWESTGLFADFRCVMANGRLYYDWSYSDVLAEQLSRQNAYFRLSIPAIRAARTMGGLSLYALCERYKTNRDGLTDRFSLPVLEAFLSGHELKESDAPIEYKRLNREKLKPAVAEVNSYKAGFTVSIREHRVGRKVHAVQFHVQMDKEQPKTPSDDTAIANLVDRLVKCGITAAKAQRYAIDDATQTLELAVQALEERIAKGTKIEHVNAYFGSLVEAAKVGTIELQGTPSTVDREEVLEPPRLTAPAEAALSFDDIITKARKQLLTSFDGARLFFEQLDEKGQAELLRQFEQEEVNEKLPLRRAYDRSGVGSALVTSALWSWLNKRGYDWEPPAEVVTRYAYTVGLFKTQN